LPSFFRLDARVAKTWVFSDFFVEAYCDVLNVTMSREVTGYRYSRYVDSGTGDVALLKQPVANVVFLPIVGLKINY
jgi:hypothetical protein